MEKVGNELEGEVDLAARRWSNLDADDISAQLMLSRRSSLERETEQLTMDVGSKARSSPVRAVRRSHFFTRSGQRKRVKRNAKWEPPQSPYGLIQEQVYSDPWKVLLCCILLNKTSITQVRRVVWRLLELCPTAEAAIATDVSAIEELIRPLGMQHRRAQNIKRFSLDFLEKEWVSPAELHGIGKYGSDAYAIFCQGNWREVQPDDKELKAYHEWLKATRGEGNALERDLPPLPSSETDGNSCLALVN